MLLSVTARFFAFAGSAMAQSEEHREHSDAAAASGGMGAAIGASKKAVTFTAFAGTGDAAQGWVWVCR